MSPAARRRRGEHAPKVHTRRDVALAVGGSAVVVGSTLLLIWLMRPGSANTFTPGSGGLVHRQPRVAWLVFATVSAIALLAWWIWRPESRVRNRRGAMAAAGALVVAAAVAGSLLWPKGILRHYASTPPITTPPITTKPTAPPAKPPATRVTSTTAPRTTTTARSSATAPRPTTASSPTTATPPTTATRATTG